MTNQNITPGQQQQVKSKINNAVSKSIRIISSPNKLFSCFKSPKKYN